MSRCPRLDIRCPCCRVTQRMDVWYDCRCFQGGNKPSCANCKLPAPEHDAAIAATIRLWGWDKNPSPGMLDYLTPGWREAEQAQHRHPKMRGHRKIEDDTYDFPF